jgi:ABC-type nitrate/sulfonate/bicarbonate transport system permease component
VLQTVAKRVGPLLMLAVLWEAVVMTGLVNRTFLPAAHDVAGALVDLTREARTWFELAVSTYRSLLGLVAGMIFGVAAGLLMATSPLVNGLLGPLVSMTYSLPKASLVPLFILWFGIGDLTIMLTVFLATLLPVVVNTYHGVKAVPPVLVWSARATGDSAWRILVRVLLPASAPQILTGIRIALGFSWVLTISAEMIAAKAGIGKLVFLYGESGAYAHMFAGILAIVVIAFVMDRLLVSAGRRWLHWHESSSAPEAGRA